MTSADSSWKGDRPLAKNAMPNYLSVKSGFASNLAQLSSRKSLIDLAQQVVAPRPKWVNFAPRFHAGMAMVNVAGLGKIQSPLLQLAQQIQDSRSNLMGMSTGTHSDIAKSIVPKFAATPSPLLELAKQLEESRTNWSNFAPGFDSGVALSNLVGKANETSLLLQLSKQMTAAKCEWVNSIPSSAVWDSNRLAELRIDLLDDVDDRVVEQLVEGSESLTDTAELEQVGKQEVHASDDPFLELCLERLSRATEWIQQRYPTYSAQAVRGIERLAATSLSLFVQTILPMLLYTNFGVPGLALGVLAAGSAKVVDDAQRAKLSPAVRNGLAQDCPTCMVPPNVWCVTTRGKNPGATASRLHAGRAH